MRRLTRLRPDDDRGAVAVIVSLLMVVLFGFGAISVDVGALYAEKRQLQNGADAAALAVAQDCCDSCSNANSIAQGIAPKNVNDGVASVDPVQFPSAGTVRVQVRATVQNSFASVLGINTSEVAARAQAACTAVSKGPAKLPLAVSICAFRAYTDDDDHPTRGRDQSIEREIPNSTNPDGTGDHRYEEDNSALCPRGAANTQPQDFVWLRHDSGQCKSTIEVSREYLSNTASNPLQNCTSVDFAEYQTKELLLPVFDRKKSSGSSTSVRILGFAAFKVTGYYFSATNYWGDITGCQRTQPCIRGHFLKMTGVPAEYQVSSTAHGLGATRPTLQYVP